MASRLVFTEARHTYALDGERVPGVTTVIGKAHDKPQLVGAAVRETAEWAAEHVADDDAGSPAWVQAAKAHHRIKWNASGARGTLLHEAARQLVRGEPITPATDGTPWPDDVVQSAEQLARFMDRWQMDPIVTERPVFHEAHRWAGTLDAVAVLRGGDRWLLDYKTGATGIYPKDALQLAAYRHATHVQVIGADGELTDEPMPEVDRAACVWVRPDFYEVRPVRSDDTAYAVFVAMLPVAQWMEQKPDQSVAAALTLARAS